MDEVITYRIGFDVAKGVFQVHAVKSEPGEPVAFSKRLKRAQVETFFARLARALIGMRLGASLGTLGAAVRARGAADAAGLRQGLCQAQQDRRP